MKIEIEFTPKYLFVLWGKKKRKRKTSILEGGDCVEEEIKPEGFGKAVVRVGLNWGTAFTNSMQLISLILK